MGTGGSHGVALGGGGSWSWAYRERRRPGSVASQPPLTRCGGEGRGSAAPGSGTDPRQRRTRAPPGAAIRPQRRAANHDGETQRDPGAGSPQLRGRRVATLVEQRAPGGAQPGNGRGDREGADEPEAGGGRRRARRGPGLRRVASGAGRGPHPAALPPQEAARGPYRRVGGQHHQGVREDARRVGSRDAPGHRGRRGRLRRPHPHAGAQQRGHRARHRRAHDPSAARRRRCRHAVQLPRHDPAVVPALCHRHRQLLPAQTEREGADDHPAAVPPSGGGGLPQGRGRAGQWRQGDGRRHPRAPRRQGGVVRGVHPGGQVHLQPRHRQRQACAVSGRREEPGCGHSPTPT